MSYAGIASTLALLVTVATAAACSVGTIALDNSGGQGKVKKDSSNGSSDATQGIDPWVLAQLSSKRSKGVGASAASSAGESGSGNSPAEATRDASGSAPALFVLEPMASRAMQADPTDAPVALRFTMTGSGAATSATLAEVRQLAVTTGSGASGAYVDAAYARGGDATFLLRAGAVDKRDGGSTTTTTVPTTGTAPTVTARSRITYDNARQRLLLLESGALYAFSANTWSRLATGLPDALAVAFCEDSDRLFLLVAGTSTSTANASPQLVELSATGSNLGVLPSDVEFPPAPASGTRHIQLRSYARRLVAIVTDIPTTAAAGTLLDPAVALIDPDIKTTDVYHALSFDGPWAEGGRYSTYAGGDVVQAGAATTGKTIVGVARSGTALYALAAGGTTTTLGTLTAGTNAFQALPGDTTTLPSGTRGVTVDPAQKILYVATSENGGTLRSRDLAAGAWRPAVAMPNHVFIALAFDASRRLLLGVGTCIKPATNDSSASSASCFVEFHADGSIVSERELSGAGVADVSATFVQMLLVNNAWIYLETGGRSSGTTSYSMPVD